MGDVLLSMKNIKKEYYGNKVLKGIDLEVKKGEIHALIGENGAGKSTLMNILFGMPVIHSTGGYEGSVEIEGEKVEIKSPFEAMKMGIGMVHQEFMLIPSFSITENIKLNREVTKKNLASGVFGKKLETLDFEKMGKDAKKALNTLEMDLDEWSKVAGLPVGHMQFIEIAREIDKEGIKILVFDEPTAVLAEAEAKHLLAAIKKLASTGIGILFISHRLSEIVEVADTVTVLRDGEFVANKPIKETDVKEIAKLMVGRDVNIDIKATNENINEETILDIKNFHVDMQGEYVKGIDLEIKKGEILGIGGLAGQGKIGIANGIMGMYQSTGEITLDGQPLMLNDPKASINSGIAFVSEDRRGVGLLLDESIEDNIAFTSMQRQEKFLKSLLVALKIEDKKAIRKHAEEMIEKLDIRCTSSTQKTGRLSGGNQQKVCVARALTQEPKLLFVSEPTRGIDIGAKKLVLDLLVKLNEELGMTIVITSSELTELKSVCDRIAIICEGKVAGILSPTDSDVDFGLTMSGDFDKIEKGGINNEK